MAYDSIALSCLSVCRRVLSSIAARPAALTALALVLCVAACGSGQEDDHSRTIGRFYAEGSAPTLLVAGGSQKCLDIDHSDHAITVAYQRTCSGAPTQEWVLTAGAGGTYRIESSHHSGECLIASGSIILVGFCASTDPDTLWTIQPYAGSQRLVAKVSGKCIDVATNTEGARASLATCSTRANQQWLISDAPEGTHADVVGSWSQIIHVPSVPVAAANLPDGKILTWAAWGREQFGNKGPLQTYTVVFDPKTMVASEVLVTATKHVMFCPGTSMLGDGSVFVNGGGKTVKTTSVYSPAAETWSNAAPMVQKRWYNTSVTLGDGTSVFTLGGNRTSKLDGRGEVFTAGSGWQIVPGAVMGPILTADPKSRSQEHPRLFLAPSGKIFVPGPTPNMQFYDLSGTGSVQSAGRRGTDDFSQNDVSVMFDIGKILKAGGNPNYGGKNSQNTMSSKRTFVIDFTNESSVVAREVAPMNYPRTFATGVLLPGGEVLVVGGLSNGKTFSDVGAILPAEVFDPVSETWTVLAPMDVPRTYHSVALLMPDGRVFVGGGGLCGHACMHNHSNAQLFSPPYLFKPDRPSLMNAPSVVHHSSSFQVTTAGEITGFSLIRMSTVTHGVNSDQRFIRPQWAPAGANKFRLTAPASGNIAPPGYYMLFALNGDVPSVAAVIRIKP